MKKIMFAAALLAFISCSKTTVPAYNYDPVLSAYLYAGRHFSLQLGHQQSTSSQTYDAPSLDGLAVTLTCGDSSYLLAGLGNGAYADTAMILQAGSQYSISFAYNGKQVSASAIVPEKPTNFTESLTSITMQQITTTGTSLFGINQGSRNELSWDYVSDAYYIVTVENIETNPVKIYDTVSTSNDTGRIFRNSPITSGSYDINERVFKYFGTHRIVLYRISADYALLYNSSSTSSQSLNTMSTGIVNGVGIFTGINADTLYMTVIKQ